jgi:serine protease Do
MNLAVIRDGRKRTIAVRATVYPAERADELAWQLLGIQLTERRAGLSVRRVRPGSSAARIGIRKGDRVVAIAGAAVKRMGAFRKKMIEVRLAQGVMLSVRRGRYVYNVAVPLKRRR